MKDLLEMVEFIAGAIIALFIVGSAVIFLLSAYQCSIKGDLYGIETKYNFSGCHAKTEYSVVPMELYENQ